MLLGCSFVPLLINWGKTGKFGNNLSFMLYILQIRFIPSNIASFLTILKVLRGIKNSFGGQNNILVNLFYIRSSKLYCKRGFTDYFVSVLIFLVVSGDIGSILAKHEEQDSLMCQTCLLVSL